MIAKLFGQTKEEQYEYLKKQLIVTIVCVVVGGFLTLIGFFPGVIISFAIPCYFIWAKRAMVSLLGVATFGAIFTGSRNIIWVVFILLAYLLIGYVVAIVCFALGLCRFIQLLTERMKQKQENEQAE